MSEKAEGASGPGGRGPAEDVRPRFVVDAMLGNVARELRLLGYDAAYEPGAEDSTLLRRAQLDGRVLITRDRGLALRARSIRCHLVRSETPSEQTAEVLSALGAARAPGAFSRCTACNGRLEPLPAEEARERVPDHVASTVGSFVHCPGCDRVYWRGSHVGKLERRVRRLVGSGTGSLG